MINREPLPDIRYTLSVVPNGAGGFSPAPTSGGSSGSTNTTSSTIPVTTNGANIAPSRTSPRRVSVFNDGTTNIRIFLKPVADTAGGGEGCIIMLFPNGLYETPVATTATVSAFSVGGNGVVGVAEFQ